MSASTPPAEAPAASTVPRRRLVRRAVVLGPFALAACGGPSEPPPDPPLDTIRDQIEAARPDPRIRWDKVEELTAACMAAQGFDYVPVPYGRPDAATIADPGDLEPGTLAYAEQFGYGLLTLTRLAPTENDQPDENLERLRSMSPGELPAYTSALWGDVEPDPDVEALGLEFLTLAGESTDPDADVGCHGEAERPVDAGRAGLPTDRYAALSAEMAALDKAVPDDPRLADVNARWASCMADAGHEGLEHVGDGEATVYKTLDDRLVEELYGDPEGMTTAEADRVMNRVQTEMAPFEVKLAVADVTCREEVGYPEELAEVTTELQTEFVAQHRAELDAWLAATTEDPPT